MIHLALRSVYTLPYWLELCSLLLLLLFLYAHHLSKFRVVYLSKPVNKLIINQQREESVLSW